MNIIFACLIILSYYFNYLFLRGCKYRYNKFFKSLNYEDMPIIQWLFALSLIISPIGLFLGIIIAACAEVIPSRME